MFSRNLLSTVLLALACNAQTTACGNGCPALNGYQIPRTGPQGQSGHFYRLQCGIDLNPGHDLFAIANITGLQSCAEACEYWNGFNQPPCVGAVYGEANLGCFLKSGTPKVPIMAGVSELSEK